MDRLRVSERNGNYNKMLNGKNHDIRNQQFLYFFLFIFFFLGFFVKVCAPQSLARLLRAGSDVITSNHENVLITSRTLT